MRIKVRFFSEERSIKLPVHYNYVIQSFIYRNLDEALAEELHKKGKIIGKRHFKLFTFSRIFGKQKRKESSFIFSDEITLFIASPLIELLESFASNIVKKKILNLNGCRIFLSTIEVFYSLPDADEIFIKTLSPITVYSTLETSDKKKKTYYYSPFEKEFSALIRKNLLKKYFLIHGKEPEDDKFSIIPEKVSNRNMHVLFYKDTVIKAWSGIYRLKGSKELIKTAYDTGLGAKNSQGFGMIEVVKNENNKIVGAKNV